jgi:hypothetical protein
VRAGIGPAIVFGLRFGTYPNHNCVSLDLSELIFVMAGFRHDCILTAAAMFIRVTKCIDAASLGMQRDHSLMVKKDRNSPKLVRPLSSGRTVSVSDLVANRSW